MSELGKRPVRARWRWAVVAAGAVAVVGAAAPAWATDGGPGSPLVPAEACQAQTDSPAQRTQLDAELSTLDSGEASTLDSGSTSTLDGAVLSAVDGAVQGDVVTEATAAADVTTSYDIPVPEDIGEKTITCGDATILWLKTDNGGSYQISVDPRPDASKCKAKLELLNNDGTVKESWETGQADDRLWIGSIYGYVYFEKPKPGHYRLTITCKQ